MNKLLIFIFTACAFFSSQAYSEIHLSDYFDATHDESLQVEGFILDKEIQDKNQIIAKQFSKQGSTQTNVVTYEMLNNGVHVHVGWYVDGSIVTALDGAEAGKQVVFINGSVVGISYDLKVYNGYFTHDYTWAKVTSYTNKQVLNTN